MGGGCGVCLGTGMMVERREPLPGHRSATGEETCPSSDRPPSWASRLLWVRFRRPAVGHELHALGVPKTWSTLL
jgi:hypothetical protein